MKYPVQLKFSKTLTCTAIFLDHPNIAVEGDDPESILKQAQILLVRNLSNLLEFYEPIKMPSKCKLGQQLVEIPEELAVRISIRNSIHLAKSSVYKLLVLGKLE